MSRITRSTRPESKSRDTPRSMILLDLPVERNREEDPGAEGVDALGGVHDTIVARNEKLGEPPIWAI